MSKPLEYSLAAFLLVATLAVGGWGYRSFYPAAPAVVPVPITGELQRAVAPIAAIAKGKDTKAWGAVYKAFAWAVRNQRGGFTLQQVNAARTRLILAYEKEGLPKTEGLDAAIRTALLAYLGDKPVAADKDRVAEFFVAVAKALGA